MDCPLMDIGFQRWTPGQHFTAVNNLPDDLLLSLLILPPYRSYFFHFSKLTSRLNRPSHRQGRLFQRLKILVSKEGGQIPLVEPALPLWHSFCVSTIHPHDTKLLERKNMN